MSWIQPPGQVMSQYHFFLTKHKHKNLLIRFNTNYDLLILYVLNFFLEKIQIAINFKLCNRGSQVSD